MGNFPAAVEETSVDKHGKRHKGKRRTKGSIKRIKYSERWKKDMSDGWRGDQRKLGQMKNGGLIIF